jgi:hypothetical protein
MEQYTNLPKDEAEWSIQLEDDPLGAAEYKEEKQRVEASKEDTNAR